MTSPSIVWFRSDLRLADHPALSAALRRKAPIVPVFIWSPEEESPWEPGAASRWWLRQSLAALDEELRRRGSRLVLRRGSTSAALKELIEQTGAGAVYWNRRYEPAIVARDRKIEEELRGLETESFNGSLLVEPWEIQNSTGRPFQVFTPFWKNCLAKLDPPPPTSAPAQVPAPGRWPLSESLDSLQLESRLPWVAGLARAWEPGEAGATKQLRRFRAGAGENYATDRDFPGEVGTSRLSPHLHFGEISPGQVWRSVRSEKFLTELGWREFAHHLLFHFPRTTDKPLRAEFEKFPWHEDAAGLRTWQRGLTGFPLVDAGMRELWATGWMHNRVRMVAGSFLVKDLLQPWQNGARWFWDTLVDADLAQNTLGWQWVSGCGADAAPFFRIFNPALQGKKFDPRGSYIRRWCPELAKIPDRWLWAPDKAPAKILQAAGIELGRTYPRPMVSHAIAREVALSAYARCRQRE